jgi:hypothetical protein
MLERSDLMAYYEGTGGGVSRPNPPTYPSTQIPQWVLDEIEKNKPKPAPKPKLYNPYNPEDATYNPPSKPAAPKPKPAAPIVPTASAPANPTSTPKIGNDTQIDITPMSLPVDTVTETPTETVDPNQVMIDYINQLKAAQLASRMAGLQNMLNSGMTNLANEEATIAPQYYDKRNQAAAASDVGAMNFAQFMASRGIKGNAGAMPEIYRQGGLNAEIGSLNRQEQGAKDTIARNRTELQNAYNSDVAAAQADVESQAMQSLINQMNTNKQFGLQEAALTGNLNGGRTLAGQQFDYSKDPMNPSNVNTMLNNQLLQKQVDAYRDPQTQQNWDNAMELWKTRGVADSYISSVLGVPINAKTSDYDMQIRQLQEQAAARKASAEAAAAKTTFNSNTTNTVDDYAATINSQWVPNSSNGLTAINTGAIQSYIDSLILSGVDPAITDALAARYGIQ